MAYKPAFPKNALLVRFPQVISFNEKHNQLMRQMASREPRFRLIDYISASSGFSTTQEYIQKKVLGLPPPPHLVYPSVPLSKSLKALLFLKQYPNYIVVNPLTSGVRLPDGISFFTRLAKDIQKAFSDVVILFNEAQVEGFTTLACDFQELYWFIVYAKAFISVRSGIEDFAIDGGTPCFSFLGRGEFLRTAV